MRTVSECFDEGNNSLERKEKTEKNPFPRSELLYSSITTVDRDGGIEIEDSTGSQTFKTGKKLTKEEEEQIIKNVNEETRRINLQLQRQQQQFNQQMQDFQRNMQAQMKQTFGPGFPFGNNNPFHNGFPFAQYNSYHPYNVPTENDINENNENNNNNYYHY